jgi:hypothetical protein
VDLPAGSDVADMAVLDGGPVDGREHPIQSDSEELLVVMTDGQQHRYERTAQVQSLPDGRIALVFEWKGRWYGPS